MVIRRGSDARSESPRNPDGGRPAPVGPRLEPLVPNFSAMYAAQRQFVAASNYRVAAVSGFGREYLSRLERGAKHPTRLTVLKLGIALFALNEEYQYTDIDRLLVSAGFAPVFTPWDPE